MVKITNQSVVLFNAFQSAFVGSGSEVPSWLLKSRAPKSCQEEGTGTPGGCQLFVIQNSPGYPSLFGTTHSWG